jgi:hypothetical protein
MANTKRKSVDSFIKEANTLHCGRYNYNNVDYKNTHTKVIITCPVHGDFLQKPNVHLSQGCGCPVCAKERHPGRYTHEFFNFEPHRKIKGIFYIAEFRYGDERFIKIGITSTSTKERYVGKKGKYSMNVLVEEQITLQDAFIKEQELIKRYNHLSYSPVNKLEGHTECFTTEILEHII